MVLWDSLREARAELAVARMASMPTVRDPVPLRARLEDLLRDAAAVSGADAAAFYMMDQTGTMLRLHVSWGLSADRMSAPARSLRHARGDLIAMLGETVSMIEHPASGNRRADCGVQESVPGMTILWNSPEPEYASAICTKVATSQRTCGTLWVLRRAPVEFTAQDQFVWEQTAARLAMELENALLLASERRDAMMATFLRKLSCRRQMQFPPVGPFLEGWDFCGGLSRSDSRVSGAGGDWFCGEHGIVVSVSEIGVPSEVIDPYTAIQASEMRMVLRSMASECDAMESLLPRIHRTLWTASAGDAGYSLLLGTLDSEYGMFRYVTAGWPGLWQISPGGVRNLTRRSEPVAATPELEEFHPEREEEIEPGTSLLLMSGAAGLTPDADRRLRAALRAHSRGSATSILHAARDVLALESNDWRSSPHTMVVIRRRA